MTQVTIPPLMSCRQMDLQETKCIEVNSLRLKHKISWLEQRAMFGLALQSTHLHPTYPHDPVQNQDEFVFHPKTIGQRRYTTPFGEE